jgi:hypothetical protein
MSTTYPLPEPYADGTAQDHADALRDHADLRMNGPLIDYLALAGADLIEEQAAELAQLRVDCDQLRAALEREKERNPLRHSGEAVPQ